MAVKIGDRTLVKLQKFESHSPRAINEFTGKIIGESCHGKAWQVLKDGTKWPRDVNKGFCQAAETTK
jgi:hypothetical protein